MVFYQENDGGVEAVQQHTFAPGWQIRRAEHNNRGEVKN